MMSASAAASPPPPPPPPPEQRRRDDDEADDESSRAGRRRSSKRATAPQDRGGAGAVVPPPPPPGSRRHSRRRRRRGRRLGGGGGEPPSSDGGGGSDFDDDSSRGSVSSSDASSSSAPSRRQGGSASSDVPPPPPPPPPASSSATPARKSLDQGGARGLLPPLLPPSSRSAPQSAPPPPPPPPPPGVPRYDPTGRMLVSSPLPSPVAPFKKKPLHEHLTKKKKKRRKRRGGRRPSLSSVDSNCSSSVGSSLYSDSDSDVDGQERKKREEESLSRLVVMAKQQQNFAAAWFAASAGGEDGVPVVGAPLKSRSPTAGSGPPPVPVGGVKALAKSAIAATATGGKGPIDVDSLQAYEEDDGGDMGVEAKFEDDKSLASTASGGSSTSKASAKLLGLVGAAVGTISGKKRGDKDRFLDETSSVASSVTDGSFPAGHARGSRSTRRALGDDVETGVRMEKGRSRDASPAPSVVAGRGGADFGDNDFPPESAAAAVGSSKVPFWKSKSGRGVSVSFVLLVVVFVCLIGAGVIIGVSVVNNNKTDDDDTGTVPGTQEDQNPPTPPMASPGLQTSSPSAVPSSFPTAPPTRNGTYAPPTGTVAPSHQPSFLPSKSPTFLPSAPPTSLPTQMPTMAPTKSAAPTETPTSAPTTVFSTATYELVGPTLVGSERGDQFGYSIASSSDGKIVAIGSRYYSAEVGPRGGEVKVYRRTDDIFGSSSWVRMGDPVRGRNELDQFGFSVDLSSDGFTLAASEPAFDGVAGDRSGNVRVYSYNETSDDWEPLGAEVPGRSPTALFGVSVSLSGDGRRLAAGSPYYDNLYEGGGGAKSGRVDVFELDRDTDDWTPLGTTNAPLEGTDPNDWYGWDVSLSFTGSNIAIGAPRNSDGGYVRSYRLFGKGETLRWVQRGDDIISVRGERKPEDRFGMAVSLSADGRRVAIGSPWRDSDDGRRLRSGMACAFEISDDSTADAVWYPLGECILGEHQNQLLGNGVVLSPDGNHLAVGSPGHPLKGINTGMVRAYRWDEDQEVWDGAREVYGDAARDELGISVTLSTNGEVLGSGSPVSAGQTNGYVRSYRRNTTDPAPT